MKGVGFAGSFAFAINRRLFRILKEVLGVSVSRRESLRLARDFYLRRIARRLACAELVMAEHGLMEEYRGMVASHCVDAELPVSGGEA